jgi:hypothetical protein
MTPTAEAPVRALTTGSTESDGSRTASVSTPDFSTKRTSLTRAQSDATEATKSIRTSQTKITSEPKAPQVVIAERQASTGLRSSIRLSTGLPPSRNQTSHSLLSTTSSINNTSTGSRYISPAKSQVNFDDEDEQSVDSDEYEDEDEEQDDDVDNQGYDDEDYEDEDENENDQYAETITRPASTDGSNFNPNKANPYESIA